MNIETIQQLNLKQYEACKQQAEDILRTKIGQKPKRSDFKIEHANQWDILTILGLILFVGAFCVSSLHIIAYAGTRAATAHHSLQFGIDVDKDLFTVIHQLGFVLLAETAMILFFVQHQLHGKAIKLGNHSLGTVQLYLAMMAAFFVVVANFSSGLNPLLSILAPAFTIGGGFLIEEKIKISIENAQETDTKYRAALAIYENASKDITQHPDYENTVKLAIWDKLMTLKANKEFADAPAQIKREAVQRELNRETWTETEVNPNPKAHTPSMNGHRQTVN